jgi:hypothetical protein
VPDVSVTSPTSSCSHSTGIKDGNCIKEGAEVEFDNTFDERKGKMRAENVTGGYFEERRDRRTTPSVSPPPSPTFHSFSLLSPLLQKLPDCT